MPFFRIRPSTGRRETITIDSKKRKTGHRVSVRPGQLTALVGPSGAGKTTIMSLLQRFCEPASGRVFVDGLDIRMLEQEQLRRQIGVVLQDALLFNESLRDNIAYGRPDASQADIEAAAKAANAHGFISQLERGYETLVGERGSRLSAGERQRVAIARAILKDPPILIFDEATAALDAETEALGHAPAHQARLPDRQNTHTTRWGLESSPPTSLKRCSANPPPAFHAAQSHSPNRPGSIIFGPMSPTFRDADFEQQAFPAVLRAGAELYERGALQRLEVCGKNYVAVFEGDPACRTVITHSPPRRIEHTCTCGFTYGGACEHVVALMHAVNARDGVQASLDFDAPGGSSDPTADELGDKATAPPATEISVRRDPPRLRLYLRELDQLLLIEPRFAYADGLAEFRRSDHGNHRLVTSPDNEIWRIERSRARELSLLADLESQGLRLYSSTSYTPEGNPRDWVDQRLSSLAAQGFEIYGSERLTSCRSRRAPPSVTLSVRGKGTWLECHLGVTIDSVPVSLCALYDAAMAGTAYVKLTDGSTGILPAEWLERLRTIFALCDGRPDDDTVRLQSRHVALLAGLDSLVNESTWDTEALRRRESLDDFNGIERRPLPPSFRGTLRSYQQAGYEWFAFLRQFHLGGCLADDMGLGKTVQTLAMLCDERHRGATPRTSLLIVPTSLLFNWVREAQTFTPTLVMATCHGPARKRYRTEDLKLADVVLTTYGTLLRDIDQFERMRFNYVIVDEAQGLRNPTGAASACVRRLRAEHRLALSGTPLENSLSELWSVMSFLNPGMLGTYSHFVKNIARPIERDSTGPAAGMLRRLVHPCILRRTKQQVAKDLPPRTESVISCEMVGRQKTLYDMTAEAWRARMSTLLQSGLEESRMELLTALLRLRQICCHPKLFDARFAGDSAKFVQIFGMLDEILADDHKVLIFSSFVGALKLISERLHKERIRHELLTGQTKDRGGMVERFQTVPSIRLMLISLKAGGTGLNLTAADYVFHFDPWWNPAAEQQASDRAYRIGQQRPVFVYKLVCSDSIEERVVRLQEAKRELFDLVITAEQAFAKKLTREDLLALFT